MRNFQDTFETRKRSFNSAFSICIAVPLNYELRVYFLFLHEKVKTVQKASQFS